MQYLAAILLLINIMIPKCSADPEVEAPEKSGYKFELKLEANEGISMDTALKDTEKYLREKFGKQDFLINDISLDLEAGVLNLDVPLLQSEIVYSAEAYFNLLNFKGDVSIRRCWQPADPEISEAAPLILAHPELTELHEYAKSFNGTAAWLVVEESDVEHIGEIFEEQLKKYPLPGGSLVIWKKEPSYTSSFQGMKELFVLQPLRPGEAVKTEHIKSAIALPPKDLPEFQVQLNFTEAGTSLFAQLTEWAAKERRCVAIMVNDQLISVPRVMEPITGGTAIISGNFGYEESNLIARFLGDPGFPHPVEIKLLEAY